LGHFGSNADWHGVEGSVLASQELIEAGDTEGPRLIVDQDNPIPPHVDHLDYVILPRRSSALSNSDMRHGFFGSHPEARVHDHGLANIVGEIGAQADDARSERDKQRGLHYVLISSMLARCDSLMRPDFA
jgi:hypothetical protein